MAKKMIPPLDLMFFLTESAESPKHVAGVQVFKLPAEAPSDFLRKLVEAYRTAPVSPPFNYRPHFPRLGMPEWREVEEMDIESHVRHLALPGPGSTAQLMETVQHLHGSLLDRRQPGWVCYVIEGLEGGRFAIYTKIHHAYIDGMSGVKRMYGALSTSPRNTDVVPSWSYFPENSKPGGSLKRRANRQETFIRQAKGVVEAAQFFTQLSLEWLNLRKSQAQIPFKASRTRMNRPLERETRSMAVCTLPLDAVKAVCRKWNCTVNEVVLAVIGGALNDYLDKFQEKSESPLVALCPMSIRSKGDHTASTRVSAVHVRLGEPDAGISDRLRQVIQSSGEAKEQVSGLSSEALMDYGVLVFALMELMNRSKLDRVIAPSYNVLVSNVPGQGRDELYLNGAHMEHSYPISTLLPGVNLNVTVLSHGNNLDFGLLGDMKSLPNLDMVARRMEDHFEHLEKEALGKSDSGAKAKKVAKKKSVKRKLAGKKTARKKAVMRKSPGTKLARKKAAGKKTVLKKAARKKSAKRKL
jgi:WS/DGAT/MGAT family acyltransferase